MMFVAATLSGCLAVVDNSNPGIRTTHYFGWVTVQIPQPDSAQAPVVALESRGLGLRIENGIGIGYFHDRQLAIPLDCRVVLLVQNQQQLDQALQQINREDQGICVTLKS